MQPADQPPRSRDKGQGQLRPSMAVEGSMMLRQSSWMSWALCPEPSPQGMMQVHTLALISFAFNAPIWFALQSSLAMATMCSRSSACMATTQLPSCTTRSCQRCTAINISLLDTCCTQQHTVRQRWALCKCSFIGASDSLRRSCHVAHAARDALLIAGPVRRPKQKRPQNRRELDLQEEVMFEDVDLDAQEMVCALFNAVAAQSEQPPTPECKCCQKHPAWNLCCFTLLCIYNNTQCCTCICCNTGKFWPGM